MIFTSKALVLSKNPFGEADQYIEFFSERWGRITLLAKSARKSKRRYVGGLDIFCHDEIFVRGDPTKRGYLNELVVLNSFQGLRDRLERLIAAGKLVQWVRKLLSVETPMPATYRLLGQTLALIEKETSESKMELCLLTFRLKLLSQLGLEPRLDACARCDAQTPDTAFFDLSSGGILCSLCARTSIKENVLLLEEEERGLLKNLLNTRLSSLERVRFPNHKILELSRLVSRFASYHTHVGLPV